MINTFKRELKKWKFYFLRAELARGFSFPEKMKVAGALKETLFLLTALPVSLSLLLDGLKEGVVEPSVLPFFLLLSLSEFLLRGFLFCFENENHRERNSGSRGSDRRRFLLCFCTAWFFLGRIIGRFSFYSSFNLCLVFPFLFIVTEGSAASTIKRRLVKADFDTLLNFSHVKKYFLCSSSPVQRQLLCRRMNRFI